MIKRRLLALTLVVESALLFPIAYQPNLRFDYIQTLSRWFAKAVRPNTVFIGDSITSAGMQFNSLRSINLGSSGLQTYQIAGLLEKARSFKPRHIAIMAGTNDAGEGPIDRAELAGLWKQICAEPKIVITLPTPTSYDNLNERIKVIDQIILSTCPQNRIIDLRQLADKNGKIFTKNTLDGVHLSPAAHTIWRSELRQYGV